MAKAGGKPSTKFDHDAYVLREAKLGNTALLRGYVRFCAGRRPLTPELSEYVAQLLELVESKRDKDEVRRIDKELIRQHVEGLMEEEGLKKESAVAEVAQSRGVSRSTIYDALGKSKKKK
jgi:hypothetical protein